MKNMYFLKITLFLVFFVNYVSCQFNFLPNANLKHNSTNKKYSRINVPTNFTKIQIGPHVTITPNLSLYPKSNNSFPPFISNPAGSISPKLPSFDNLTGLADNSFDKLKDLPIISSVSNIPKYFSVNSLTSAIDYLRRFGFINYQVNLKLSEDLLKLKDAFKKFQSFFGLSTTGLFDQETLELMNLERCGMPDVYDGQKFFSYLDENIVARTLMRRKRYQVYSAKYEKRNLTWTVLKFSQKSLKDQDEEVLKVIGKAFKIWENVTNLSFEYNPNNNLSDILISFETKKHGNPRIEPQFYGENDVVLAHTSYPTDYDVHYNDDKNWSLYPKANHSDLYTVTIHELGHKIGLRHTTVKEASLYPIYNPLATKLHQDDVKGAQSLYGIKQQENDKEKDIVDLEATEKPETEDNVDSSNEDSDKPIKISKFKVVPNVNNDEEFNELTGKPCQETNIDSSVCMKNDKCLIISGDYNFWMDKNLKLIRRKKERNDKLFKGLKGPIDAIYRNFGLIHIIQGQNVTTYDSFYDNPISKSTLSEHFPNFPEHVKRVNSVFKKTSTGIIYIYSGDLYWRYSKKYKLGFPRIVWFWGLPSNIKSILHFNNGQSLYIKNDRYWQFNESINRLLSIVPGSISNLNLCKGN